MIEERVSGEAGRAFRVCVARCSHPQAYERTPAARASAQTAHADEVDIQKIYAIVVAHVRRRLYTTYATIACRRPVQ